MSIYVILAVIALASAMACYVLISQAVERRRVYKYRILMALKTRQRNIVHMLNGFPPQFLPKELMSMIYRVLIDTSEQLQRIEPDDSKHPDEISTFNNHLSALAKSGNAEKSIIDNPKEIKLIRQHLQELKQFIHQQKEIKFINKVQADAYLDQIKRLGVQVSLDETLNQAKLAQQSGKPRLAIHHFALAKKQYVNENTSHTFDKQIAQLDATIHNLEAEVAAAEALAAENAAANEAKEKEWEEFNKKEEKWQVKRHYD